MCSAFLSLDFFAWTDLQKFMGSGYHGELFSQNLGMNSFSERMRFAWINQKLLKKIKNAGENVARTKQKNIALWLSADKA